MNLTKVLFFCLLFVTPVAFGEEIFKVTLPTEVKQEVRSEPDEIKGKVWNRWTSENFVVCALDEDQASYLNQNLEKIKTWIYSRWGLEDSKFAAECRIICVSDKVLFKKLFGLSSSKAEIRKDNSGRIKLTVVYLLFDSKPSNVIPPPLTEVCLAEYEQRTNVKFSWWVHRGMSRLNATVNDIKTDLTNLKPLVDKDQPMYFSQGILNMTESDYIKQSEANRLIYDYCSSVFCLLLRKEFGQDKFLEFLTASAVGNKPENALINTYHFDGFNDFDVVFKSYVFDLIDDIVNNKTPDKYLQVNAKP